MQNKRYLLLIILVGLLMTTCQLEAEKESQVQGVELEISKDDNEQEGVESDTETVGEFHIAWPYTAPPAGHFNSFVTDALNLGIYHHLMQPPLFLYMWQERDWMPMGGQSWEWVDEVTLRVHLQARVFWSDGTPYSVQDVIDTFDILRLQNTSVWRFLARLEAINDTTVDFIFREASAIAPRLILREVNIRPSSTYHDWAVQARELVDQGLQPGADEWRALHQDFNEFRPDSMVVLGPYQIDPESITEAQMILNKNETSFMADWVNFDRLINFNGGTPEVTPLVLTGDIDYATHGFPVATEAQFMAEDIRIIRAPMYTGPALYFNMDIYPFRLPQFRQAIAYAVDRDENGHVSLGESGKRQIFMSGLSDGLAANWLTEETKGDLNQYKFDLDRSQELLTELGFSRDEDGFWLDDTETRMEFVLKVPTEFIDWSTAAENLAEQLTAFGIMTTVRGVPFQQHFANIYAGEFQLAIASWGAMAPHPYFSYDANFNSFNFTGSKQFAANGNGMNWPLVQHTEQGELDLETLVDQVGRVRDEARQKEIVNQLALAYNELLPQIPLWERYTNHPARNDRISGWPSVNDPVYHNSSADPFVIVLLMNGTLHPNRDS